MRDRTILLLTLTLALGVAVVVLVGVGWFLKRHFIAHLVPSQTEMPPDLEAPGVLLGSDAFSKGLFLEDRRLGGITDIVMGELDPSPGVEIGLAGPGCVLFTDKDARVKSVVSLGGRTAYVKIVDIDADGVCEFLNRGSWGIDASLIDHGGKVVWSYGGSPGVNDTAMGDVDGDGIPEIVVGFNGGGGVHLLNKDGQLIWKMKDSNVWHVEITDTDGDGRLEILHSDVGGRMKVRDGRGMIVRRAKPKPYFSHFSLARWPGKDDRPHAIQCGNATLYILDFEGRIAARLPAPACHRRGDLRGMPARMGRNGDYFAVVAEFGSLRKSTLYVYDRARTLVYQEILPERCAAVAAVPLGSSDADSLLVGCEGKVWRYDLRPQV